MAAAVAHLRACFYAPLAAYNLPVSKPPLEATAFTNSEIKQERTEEKTKKIGSAVKR